MQAILPQDLINLSLEFLPPYMKIMTRRFGPFLQWELQKMASMGLVQDAISRRWLVTQGIRRNDWYYACLAYFRCILPPGVPRTPRILFAMVASPPELGGWGNEAIVCAFKLSGDIRAMIRTLRILLRKGDWEIIGGIVSHARMDTEAWRSSAAMFDYLGWYIESHNDIPDGGLHIYEQIRRDIWTDPLRVSRSCHTAVKARNIPILFIILRDVPPERIMEDIGNAAGTYPCKDVLSFLSAAMNREDIRRGALPLVRGIIASGTIAGNKESILSFLHDSQGMLLPLLRSEW